MPVEVGRYKWRYKLLIGVIIEFGCFIIGMSDVGGDGDFSVASLIDPQLYQGS